MTATTPEEKKVLEYFQALDILISVGDWKGLQERIRQDAHTVLKEPDHLRQLGRVLGFVASFQAVPKEVFEVVMQVAGESAFMYTDEHGRTPFHEVQKYLDRPDITRIMLASCPTIVDVRDEVGLRGIDILTQKILMKEEHLRYLKDRASPQDHQSLADCLECARLVTIHHGEERDLDMPMLHACCLAHGNVPLSLVERTLRRYGALQALVRDRLGNTPLHYASAYISTEEIDDLLPRVLRICRGAAAVKNNNDEYPLDLAVRAGRRWDSGCRILLEAYSPAVLLHQCSDIRSGREMVFELMQRSLLSPVFDILRSEPELLAPVT